MWPRGDVASQGASGRAGMEDECYFREAPHADARPLLNQPPRPRTCLADLPLAEMQREKGESRVVRKLDDDEQDELLLMQ